MFTKDIFINLFERLRNFFPIFLFAILILVIGWALSSKAIKIIKKAMQRAKLDEGIISFTGSILLVFFRAIVVLASLSKFGVDVTALIAALGAAFVTVGIALKDSLSNIASGIIIILNKPFRVGEFLEFGGKFGKVLKTDLMFTTLLTDDNRELIVPNSTLTAVDIINCSRQNFRRIDLQYTAKDMDDVNKVKDNFSEATNNNPKILKVPEPSVTIKEIGGENIKILATAWCSSSDYDSLRDEIQEDMLMKE